MRGSAWHGPEHGGYLVHGCILGSPGHASGPPRTSLVLDEGKKVDKVPNTWFLSLSKHHDFQMCLSTQDTSPDSRLKSLPTPPIATG